MKAKKFLVALFATLSAIGASAQAELSIKEFMIDPGQTGNIVIELNSEAENVIGLQATVTLPEGLQFVTNKRGKVTVTLDEARVGEGDDANENTVSTNVKTDGSLGIVVTEASNFPFYETSGALMYVPIQATETWESGSVKVSDIVFSLEGNKKVKQEAFETSAATAIVSVKAEAALENAAIYNMAGQRVNKAYKGVVISNGKKYMNK